MALASSRDIYLNMNVELQQFAAILDANNSGIKKA